VDKQTVGASKSATIEQRPRYAVVNKAGTGITKTVMKGTNGAK
jgi:hypothetical protein